MKKKLSLLLSLIFALSTLTSVTSASTFFIYPKGSGSNVNVYVNDALTQQEVPARVVNNRTMVPLRGIFEALGAQVQWDNQTRAIIATKDTTTIELHLDSTTAVVNGLDVTLDVPPMIINGRTMVPIHFVSDALGAHVTWDLGTESVFVAMRPLPTIKAMNDYLTSLSSYSTSFKNAYNSINENLNDYMNNKISYTDFKSNFDAQLKILQDIVDSTKSLPIPTDTAAAKMAQENLQLWEQYLKIETDTEDVIHPDYVGDINNIMQEKEQFKMNQSAFEMEFLN